MITNQDSEKYYQLLTNINKNCVRTQYTKKLYASLIDTCLGPMVIIANDTAVYFIHFLYFCALPDSLRQLQKKTGSTLLDGRTKPIHTLENELIGYFQGTLTTFVTPLLVLGTLFQQAVWKTLQTIPFGQTASYSQVAIAVGKPTAYRAVAQANAANPFCVVIPCHRVINSNGSLGGYSSGLERKEWLLHHERTNN